MKDTLALLLSEKKRLVGGYVAVYENPGTGKAPWNRQTRFIIDPHLSVHWDHSPLRCIGRAITFDETPHGITILARLFDDEYLPALRDLRLGWSLRNALPEPSFESGRPVRNYVATEVSLSDRPSATWSWETTRMRMERDLPRSSRRYY